MTAGGGGARRSAWALCVAAVTLTFAWSAIAAERAFEGALACNALCEAWMRGEILSPLDLAGAPASRPAQPERAGAPGRVERAGPESFRSGLAGRRLSGWRPDFGDGPRAQRLPPWAPPTGWRFGRRVGQAVPERADRGQGRPGLDGDRRPSPAPKAERVRVADGQGAFPVGRSAPVPPPRRFVGGLVGAVPLPPTVDRGLDPTTPAEARQAASDPDRVDGFDEFTPARPVQYAPDGIPAALALPRSSNRVPAAGIAAELRRIPSAGRTEAGADPAPAAFPAGQLDAPSAFAVSDRPSAPLHLPTSGSPGGAEGEASRPGLAGALKQADDLSSAWCDSVQRWEFSGPTAPSGCTIRLGRTTRRTVEAERPSTGPDDRNSGGGGPAIALRPDTMLPLEALLWRSDVNVTAMLLCLVLIGSFATSFRNAWRELDDVDRSATPRAG